MVCAWGNDGLPGDGLVLNKNLGVDPVAHTGVLQAAMLSDVEE